MELDLSMGMNLQIFLLLGIIVIWFMMHRNIKKEKINFKYVYTNYLILFGFLILLIPPVIPFLLLITGIKAPTSLVFVLVLAYLFYMSFLQQLKIAKQSEQIETMARIISLKNAEGNKNEKN